MPCGQDLQDLLTASYTASVGHAPQRSLALPPAAPRMGSSATPVLHVQSERLLRAVSPAVP